MGDGRAGGVSGQRFPWGSTISESQANYLGDTTDLSHDLGPDGCNSAYDDGVFPYTSPLGSFQSNGYGLYDMPVISLSGVGIGMEYRTDSRRR